ncbi:MAG TPA: hypothetical protein VKV30_16600 [Candidatus Angelobacter sp.]|nr:hypothetical protein [Candidatus Angelobacter sp.]
MINRRSFIKSTGIVGAGALALRGRAWPFSQGPAKVRKFVTSLPGLGPSGKNEIGQYIPLATKSTMNFAGLTTDIYSLAVGKLTERMHPDLPGPTDFLGDFDLSTLDQKYLGGIIVAKRNTPVILKVENRVPNRPIIPVDPTVMAGPGLMVGDLPYNRIVTHLHGGLIPWFSDGTPFQWYTPSGQHGASFLNVPGFPAPPTGTAVYYYPNQQSARLVWYHDHAIGITRTNAYAGIASGYIITDDFEANLVASGLLPDLVGIPLIIQDKGFVPADFDKQDPGWKWGKPGDLWYPHQYEANILSGGVRNRKGRWDWGPTAVPPAKGTQALPAVSLVPETFFDTTLVNGGLYPKISVPSKRVRFRMLNGSQARFYHMNLYAEDLSNAGEANLKKPGPVMYQTGTEGGFLPAVAVHNNKTPIPLLPPGKDPNMANPDGPFNLLLAPGERADLVIDFNGVPAGSTFILYNDAPAPFPGGDSRNDYFTGDGDQTAIGGAPNTQLGFGPNSRTLMRFVVTGGAGDSVASPTWLANLNVKLRTNFLDGNQLGLLYHGSDLSVPGALPYTGPVDRKLTLVEEFDDHGRLIQLIGPSPRMESIIRDGLPGDGFICHPPRRIHLPVQSKSGRS